VPESLRPEGTSRGTLRAWWEDFIQGELGSSPHVASVLGAVASDNACKGRQYATDFRQQPGAA